MQYPITVAIDQEGWIGNPGDLFVSDYLGNQILQIDPDTGVQTVFVDNSSGLFDGAGGLGFDLDGNLYVGNVNSIHITKIDPGGTPSLFFMDYAAGLDSAAGIQADGLVKLGDRLLPLTGRREFNSRKVMLRRLFRVAAAAGYKQRQRQ